MAGRGPPTGPPTPDIVASTPGSTSSKVAIPRLKRDSEVANFGPQQGSEKSRVSHACEPCRQRKTKCDGGSPCRHCTEFKINCFYGDGKREKAKNEARYLQERVETYEKTLENIYANNTIDTEVKAAIVKALKDSANWQERLEGSVKAVNEGRREVTAPEGSRVFMRLDKVAEDFGATPDVYRRFLGISPCLPWSIDTNLDRSPSSGSERDAAAAPESAKEKEPMRYDDEDDDYDDDSDELRVESTGPPSEEPSYDLEDRRPMNNLPPLEQCYGLPDRRVVDAFVDGFFNTVHLAFPIIYKPQFIQEYRDYMDHDIQPEPFRTWLATMNIILAVGAIFTQLTDDTSTKWSNGYDQRIFYIKAQALYYNTGILINNPEQRHVQALGVLGVYFLATKQINRCWNVVGLAIRTGYSLGLHLSSELTQLGRIEQEVRHRKWYALMSLERTCGLLTGRPINIDEGKYSIPDLSGVNEEKLYSISKNKRKAERAKPGTQPPPPEDIDLEAFMKREFDDLQNTDHRNGFFLQSSKLYSVSLDILTNIYSAGAAKLTWRRAEDVIAFSGLKLERWKIGGGDALFPIPTNPDPDALTRRKKNLLYLDYLNTVILLNWPCLCRVKDVEAEQRKAFNKTASVACLNAALDTIRLLPDDTDQPIEFWSAFPWWIVLYYIVSSGIVVMMEITLKGEHMPEQKDELYMASEKVIRWLNYMGQTDVAAKRSSIALSDILVDAAPHIGRIYLPPPRFDNTRAEESDQQVHHQQQPQMQHPFILQQAQQHQHQLQHQQHLFQHHQLHQQHQHNQQLSYGMQEMQHDAHSSSADRAAGEAVQHQLQGFEPFSGNTTVTTAQLSDLSQQHQTLLGVPGMNILAQTGYDTNMAILESYPFRPIAEHAAAAADQDHVDHPMQLAPNEAPQLWDWPGYNHPHHPHHSVQMQMPMQAMQMQPMPPMQPMQPIPSMQQPMQQPMEQQMQQQMQQQMHAQQQMQQPMQPLQPLQPLQQLQQLQPLEPLQQLQQIQQMQQMQQIHSPHHGSEQHTPVHEFPTDYQAHLFQPVTAFAPGYHQPMYEESGDGGFHHSPVERDYIHGTPSPGLLHPNDAQYHRGHGQ
ncbi:ABC-transporter-regulating transcription factor [Drechslerella dactyloides]|uniref:ABC-transporter-regulating transcription factor n=1 Tax=Drechslerella dactyloides TaxID=74499 RepID=A0AAD6J6E3_DREDA|nr:ABC-transporter-regulating transcription factor [Drechslerella dactyloides]